MPFSSIVQAALARLASFYNGDVQTPSNPGGFDGDGHYENFIPSLRDVASVGQAVSDIATEVAASADRFEAALAAIEQGPVASVVGKTGVITAEDINAAIDRPPVWPAAVVSPANGATAALVGGVLTLSVSGFYSDYGKKQKAIRIQVDNNSNFASPEFDRTDQTQSVSVAINDAQTRFAAGATLYTRSQQTDEDGKVGTWSAVTSFVFPNAPNAPSMSAPAAGATAVGAQNQPITFTASTYSHPSGVVQAARRFEISKDNFATIITLAGTVAQNSATLSSPRDTLTANTAYKVRAVDTDANGNSATGAATTFTTVAQFKPGVGEAYEGGFLAFERFGDGGLFDLVIAAKSTEASKTWGAGSVLGAQSRLNGPANTDLIAAGQGSGGAGTYSKSVLLNGTAAYLGAVDEMRAIGSKLKPSAAQVAAFQAGGSEVFGSAGYWTSTEEAASSAFNVDLSSATPAASSAGKTSSFVVRPIKRVAATLPYPLGTAMEGGYLAAYFTDFSSGSPQTYMLIVADKAAEASRAWDTSSTLRSGASRTNGDVNSTGSTSGTTAAMNYCLGLASGGKDDWYLPAIDEMLAIARMNSQLASAQQLVASGDYWASTEVDASNAKRVAGSGGSFTEVSAAKANSYLVRPVRRVLLP